MDIRHFILFVDAPSTLLDSISYLQSQLTCRLSCKLNFVTLVTLFGLSLSAAYLYYRYKYLTIYADLKELPLGKPNIKELHPDAQGSEDQPTTFHGYLDEFLAAVRIFGFLEKPVSCFNA